jgi:hypothetical protein
MRRGGALCAILKLVMDMKGGGVMHKGSSGA